jgi:hypothetical protein
VTDPSQVQSPHPSTEGAGLPGTQPASASNGQVAPAGPVRSRILEAMERRMAGQPDPVRRLLQQKLERAGAEDALPSTPVAPKEEVRRDRPAPTPLAQLNLHVRATVAARAEPQLPGETHDADELASLKGFRRAWARGRTLEQVEQAMVRKPANAGPLNSHALVLQTLSLMRDLSPDYLRRFVAGVEALQWLERASEQLPRDAAKAARRGTRARTKK